MNEINYQESNIYRPFDWPKTAAQVPPQSIRCPHCRQLGSAHMIGNTGFQYQKKVFVDPVPNPKRVGDTVLSASIHICPNPNCKGLLFVIREPNGNLTVQPPELIDFNSDGIPERCQQTIKEAVACHSAGAYRAASMMVRRLLEEICDENGATGKDLHKRLDSLKTKVVLPRDFFAAMMELKILGNDAAHVEARQYDQIGRDEAGDAIELVKEILKALYQLKGLVSRLQARKNSKSD